ncbi:MAG: hypothetical protein Ta2A_14200 [Treponemataceae bacterium]|nr:MAG: hypothetical protein Ta2A_14200 [Treponemataceae bacterium]
MTYTDMTDEEYDALDEELTRTIPKLGPNGSGWLAQRELRLLGLTKAAADSKNPAKIPDKIFDDFAPEKIAVTAV